MRASKKENQTPRTTKVLETKSVKKGNFTKEELDNYGLSEEEIEIVLEYQKRLPILQEDNESWTSSKLLHEQLGVSRDFSDWIKQQINDLDLQEVIDFKLETLSKGNQDGHGGDRRSIDYIVKVSTAKEIAMIAGVKGGNTSKQLKETSRIARKYFITVEKAFKNRLNWNVNRRGSIINCKPLKAALIRFSDDLIQGKPQWMSGYTNVYQMEFTLLNSVIIGMSASKYREIHKISNKKSIRNYFTEDQLDDVERLELYDSQLIMAQNIFDYDQRYRMLEIEYSTFKNSKSKWV